MNLIRKPFKYTYKNAVFAIIAVNSAVFLFVSVFKTASIYLGLVPIAVLQANTYWQFFTYQFVHGSFLHLFFNMLALYYFGVPIEQKTGTKEFLLYYFLIGTLGGVFSFFIYYAAGMYIIVLMGASGAVFGILLLYAVLFPHSVIYLWAVIPVPAPVLILGYAVIELIGIFSANDGVAHLTHFLGLLFGWLYILIRFGVNPIKIWNSSFR